MIRIQVDFPNGMNVVSAFGIDKSFFNSTMKKVFFGVANTLVNSSKSMMEKPKSGRTYKIAGRTHIASSEGESPAILTGKLFDSVRVKTFGTDIEFGAGGRGIGYAKYLEIGTSKMKKRPFILPAVEENYKNILTSIESAVSGSLI
jgi:HK97 gp10 family phage protein